MYVVCCLSFAFHIETIQKLTKPGYRIPGLSYNAVRCCRLIHSIAPRLLYHLYFEYLESSGNISVDICTKHFRHLFVVVIRSKVVISFFYTGESAPLNGRWVAADFPLFQRPSNAQNSNQWVRVTTIQKDFYPNIRTIRGENKADTVIQSFRFRGNLKARYTRTTLETL